MRMFAYVVAAIAAVIIVISIARMPSETVVDDSRQSETAEPTTTLVLASEGDVKLDVPEMHCPFACYPRVKELLEKTEGVESVDLAEQKEEGMIDNPQVIVHHKSGFDLGKAIAMLEQQGFTNTTMATN